MTLARYDNKAELKTLIKYGNAHGEEEFYWVGANDRKKEGAWVWTDGTPLEFKNWAEDEPNNDEDSEHCGGLYTDDKSLYD